MTFIGSNQLINTRVQNFTFKKLLKIRIQTFLVLFWATEKSLKFLVTIQNIVMNKSIVHRDNIRK